MILRSKSMSIFSYLNVPLTFAFQSFRAFEILPIFKQLCPLRKESTFRGSLLGKTSTVSWPWLRDTSQTPVVQNWWRYGIHWLNLYPVDNAFWFPYYLSAGWWFIQWIALSNVWTKNRDHLSAVWLLGEYPRPQTDLGMVYGISNSRSESVNLECWGVDGT